MKQWSARFLVLASARLLVAAMAILLSISLPGQQTAQPAPAANAANTPASMSWTAVQDHQNMMDQLGIKALRPGPNGNETAPNHANYDESTANPFPNLPDVLTLKNGRKVTTADMWWNQRRPEIVEDFDREVLGRVPRNVPKVTWTVTNTITATVAGRQPASHRICGPPGDTLISSSRSGQWIPSPRAMRRQLPRSVAVPCAKRGNQASGTVIVLPSARSTTRASSLTLWASASLSSVPEVLMP